MDKCVKMMEGNVISVRVPIKIKRCSEKKMILMPEGPPMSVPQEALKPDETLVNTLAKVYYWQNLLNTGCYKSIDDMSRQRNINASYISRILRLNQLAPKIKKAILDGTQPRPLSLQNMQTPFSDLWEEQLKHFCFT